jgi:hypothetical protein
LRVTRHQPFVAVWVDGTIGGRFECGPSHGAAVW